MSDDEHPELDWDPLDDTKTWPKPDSPPTLVDRTLGYSDTQRYRAGPDYLQLPVNSRRVPVATNQTGARCPRAGS
ncbi:catalase [Arthrobacter mobilis]|uniref:catalase n=1 Tax=Arthrobacter mobilis TaxID=2724944 RepID=UPI002483A692|nr:catalase [Arthrobacter mobilis]